ncbi:hypothetical protein P9112_001009 [Eukaryota sp. TZLM1-RC]
MTVSPSSSLLLETLEDQDLDAFIKLLQPFFPSTLHICALGHLFLLSNDSSTVHHVLPSLKNLLTSWESDVCQDSQLTSLLGISHLSTTLFLSSPLTKSMLTTEWQNKFISLVKEEFPEHSLIRKSSNDHAKSIEHLFSSYRLKTDSVVKSLVDLVCENIGAFVAVLDGESLSVDYIKSIKRRLLGFENVQNELKEEGDLIKGLIDSKARDDNQITSDSSDDDDSCSQISELSLLEKRYEEDFEEDS